MWESINYNVIWMHYITKYQGQNGKITTDTIYNIINVYIKHFLSDCICCNNWVIMTVMTSGGGTSTQSPHGQILHICGRLGTYLDQIRCVKCNLCGE